MAGAGKAVGTVVFCLCGPIGSLCCFVLSTWGVIMLFLLGVFYYVEAAVLFEDFEGSLKHINQTEVHRPYFFEGVEYFNSTDVTNAYHHAAYSCWGAAVIYLLFLILSGTFMGINVWRKKQQ